TPPPPPPPKRPAEVRPASPPMNPEPPAVEKALAQAGQAERRGNLLEAMQAVQRGQRSQPSARQQTALQAIFERLRRDLSSYRIQSLRAGACVAGERVWHKPGKHIVSNADGKEINTYLSAGKEYVCDFCSPTGIFSCKENH
ncbi:MAG TPA: hypothetical protein PKI03_32895, partial [Pseudomonadota bacterium]|nr:hypothetical protein [Pseudomonadota bacterium]